MDNCVYVGNKPFMNYVTAVVTQANSNKLVTIKARGKYISRAVDIGEVATRRFVAGSKIGSIRVGSEEFENKDGKMVRVSTIELDITQ
jgi:archaea-specific DNA-binding protein